MKRQLLSAAISVSLLGPLLRAEDQAPNQPMSIDTLPNPLLSIAKLSSAEPRAPWADTFSGVIRSHGETETFTVKPFSVQQESFPHWRALPAPSNVKSYRFNGDTVYVVPLVATAGH